jgi:8-oxo-dGTP pyrophosphatase MutT (NUDIX family)
MSIETRQLIIQSGVIPWRVADGRLWILLITSSNGKRWGIPKGHLEPFLPAHESAAIEAYEEAGVTGLTLPASLGSFRYHKRSHEHVVEVYSLQVLEELQEWPEKGKRLRKWLPQEKAALRVGGADLAELILRIPFPDSSTS